MHRTFVAPHAIRIVASLAGAAYVLAGCAVSPAAAPPLDPKVTIPAQWSSDAPGAPGVVAAIDSRWWTAWGDPVLTDWVERALQANTDVAAALAAVAQARALRDVAQAATGPSLGAGASAQRAQTGDTVARTNLGAKLDASWEIDLFGRRAAALQAGQADMQASEAALGQVRVTLAAEVVTTYLEAWGVRERLRVTQESLRAQEEALQLTQWRAQAGLASDLDVQTARAAVEQVRASIPALQASARQARHALAVLAGQAPGVAVPEPPAAPPEPPAAWSLPVPADVLRQRPDVAAAEARLQAAFARSRQAQAARWPTLNIGGTLSLAAPRVSDLFDAAALTRSLTLALAASVFDGGAAQAQVRAQEAAIEQARAALQGVLLAALRDVENALVALAADRERLGHLQAAVAAAAEAEALASQRYRAGLIDYRTLLDAQRTLLSLQGELAAARTAWATDHVRLIKALGGGWAPTADGTALSATPH
ncbi:efflux transporter outer membrane subunit [Tepidimonas sp.]|uniref:efflux transporter outer membrane subunit n=1 Tax=Tepidimonas sp. TaxID=2002775 RepID=UPI0028CCFC10|nr:efflux transporter outer membrane subunit [Tepidimonas sp.]MDT7928043.1 efflux transporter outer membrane subunit [Tepidimonas sp.]